MKLKQNQVRQGDVFLKPVAKLPAGCIPMEPENGTRFVLAHGEITGHAHAIYEFTADQKAEQALARSAEIATATLERLRKLRTVQMWVCPAGEWYLAVRQSSTMRHEEHSAATLSKGFYHCPVQVESNSSNMLRQVAD